MTPDPASKHIIVVGAGPGGLTAAMILAGRGFRVTVFEKKDHVGGRNASIELGPYTFDTGPTFLMMKDILDEVFHEAGTSSDSELEFTQLDPMYRLQFPDKQISPTSNREKMVAEIRRVFPGHEDRYQHFIDRESLRFKKLFPCLQKSYHKLGTLFSMNMIKALPHLAAGKSLFSVMYDCFGDEDLALSFTFQAKYLGMSPWECPGLFAIIPYIEHGFGIYHTTGGLSSISDAMADVARRNGADFRLGTPVKQLIVENAVVKGVSLEDGERIEADEVVLNADFGHAATHLFAPGELRKYTPKKLDRLKLSCSTFMMYLGLDRTYDMPHHTVVFANNYRANVEAVFRYKDVTDDVSFYIRNATVTDPGLAPEGHSALYILMPAANNRSGLDWSEAGARYREMILDAIASRTDMGNIRPHIKEEKVITPADWQTDYDVYQGATFNLAHNLGQMIYLRPRNKFEEVDNCYLVGGGTHPGSGLPTIYESGRIAANLISRRHKISFTSGNIEV